MSTKKIKQKLVPLFNQKNALDDNYVNAYQELEYFEEMNTFNDDNKIDEKDYLKNADLDLNEGCKYNSE